MFWKKDRFKLWKLPRRWNYAQPTPDFYCSHCNNLDPFQLPRDSKGNPRPLEPEVLGLAPRRPVVKDFTPRRNHTQKSKYTVRQDAKWQFLEGEKLSFDISYEDLLQGGLNGCPSCALLFDIGKRFEGKEAFERYFTVNENFTEEPVSGIDSEAPEDVMGIYVHISHIYGLDFNLNLKTFTDVDIEVFCSPNSVSPWQSIGTEILIPPDPRSIQSFQAVSNWLQICQTSHPKCLIDNHVLPKRLLDVKTTHSPEIQLVDSGQVDRTSGYIALSHCWGKEQIITTTRTTEPIRRKGINLNDLSKTFQDVVEVTRHHGFRYLWIDSLCIIQQDAEDWQEESGKMATVYEKASLVISASSSADGRGGCFSIREHSKYRSAEFEGEMKDGSTKRNWTILARRTIPHTIQSLTAQEDPRLPLFSRGWCYQERLLATRILHFGPDELVWECKSVMSCECGVVNKEVGFKPKYHESCEQEREAKSARESETIFDAIQRCPKKQRVELLRNFRGREQDATDSNIWHRVITNFSRRKLTNESDRLPALSGLAKASAVPSKGSYVAGLWSNTLNEDLVWENTNSSNTGPAKVYVAPSWSWAALTGCMPHFTPRPDVLDSRILDVRCTAAGLDPTGAISTGYIDIIGPLQKVTLFYQDSDSVKDTEKLVRGFISPPQKSTRRFYVSLDNNIRNKTTYGVSSDLNINNYKGRFGTRPGALPLPRIRKIQTQRVLLDISSKAFLDSTSPTYLPPSAGVYVLLVGRTKVVQWRESAFALGSGEWEIIDNEELLRALVLRQSAKVDGAFERIGIIDPDPEIDNPFPPVANDGKHPLTDHAADFFRGAEEVMVRIV